MRSWSTAVRRRLRLFHQARKQGHARLFLRAFVFGIALRAWVRLPITQWHQRFCRPLQGPPPGAPELDRLVHSIEAALIAGRPAIQSGCLIRGLTLHHFLRNAGVDVDLCFGMGRQGDDLAGHCWLVRDGIPFLEKHDPRQRYSVVFTLSDGPGIPAPAPAWIH